ncbi:thylakoid membrane photosystem I accumulation factor [Prochlorococcus marinus]|uniref:thylakoid membrane photosystem I accumulation factor n=1 Tax=Prochlorococcus marinus TaxID=1219 RepID=UPI0022B3DA81|nr:thylakoid membrane photosystem I accumulation factor [Prochlorococcus marinus]
MSQFIKKIFIFISVFLLTTQPVIAARDTDSFDGNIYPIYAGNGSLVPPQSTLRDSIKNNRTSVIIFYLDDSSASKMFAPVVSGLKLLWTSTIDLIPLTIDEFQEKESDDPLDESYYWHGNIPQVVVINGNGEVLLDSEGQVSLKEINKAISNATGLEPPDFTVSIKSFNEYNSDASKDGYTDPR